MVKGGWFTKNLIEKRDECWKISTLAPPPPLKRLKDVEIQGERKPLKELLQDLRRNNWAAAVCWGIPISRSSRPLTHRLCHPAEAALSRGEKLILILSALDRTNHFVLSRRSQTCEKLGAKKKCRAKFNLRASDEAASYALELKLWYCAKVTSKLGALNDWAGCFFFFPPNLFDSLYAAAEAF